MEDRRHNDDFILAELRGFRELFEERTNNIETTLSRVEQQTIKTNGRVTVLEMVNAEARGGAKIHGALWGMVSSVIVAVMAFFINKQLQ